MSVLQNAVTQQVPPHVTITEAKQWLQVPSGDTSKDLNLQLIIDMACQWTSNFCQRPIAPITYDRRFDGWSNWNGAYIELPWYPVLEIESVTEYWGVAGPHYLEESTPTDQIDGWQCVYQTGRLNRVFPGNVQKPWFPGSRNIEVVWTAGYNPIPADIKVATLELIAHWYRNTQQQTGRVNGGAITPAAEFEPASDQVGGLWAGVPYRITTLLAPYISINIS